MLLGGLQAMMLAIAALFWKRSNGARKGTFAGIMGLLGLMMVSSVRAFSEAGPPIETAPYALAHMWGAFALLLGPLIYFHVRTSVDAGYLFKASRSVHGIPALLHLSLLIPLAIVGPDLRADYIQAYIDRELYRSFIPEIRVGLVVTLIYVVASFFWIRRFERHMVEVASFDDERHVRWLKSFTLMLLLLMSLVGVFSLFESFQIAAAITIAGLIFSVSFVAIAWPDLFHGIAPALQLDTEQDEEKYVASSLEDHQKETFLKRIREHFNDSEPYLDHELTLRQVSDQVDIPHRYVSQVINERLGQHFMDFVNSYRVERAQALLNDPSSEHLSIDGIGWEAGFKSRSAFYTAFKKVTSTTPGAFRRQSKSSS